mmetsp:Transcript_33432/g.51318  ORF Transcript_33432/g.51318 Transcript_33432/m.51318 type:complete len:128 (-) Transcript_33432:10-393(-)
MKFMQVEDEEMQRRKKTVQREFPLHVSNVSLIDPESGTPTRITWGYLEDGSKVRVAKKSGNVIPTPDRDHLRYQNRTKSKEMGEFDTPPSLVLEKTYQGEDFVSVFNQFEEYIRMKEEKEELLVFKH